MPQKPPAPSQSMGLSGGTRPRSLSSRLSDPKRASNWRKPMAPTNGGIIIGTSSRLPSSALPRNLNRVITQAIGRLIPVVRPVVSEAMTKLFRSDSRCSGLERSSEKNWRLKWPFATKAPLSNNPTG